MEDYNFKYLYEDREEEKKALKESNFVISLHYDKRHNNFYFTTLKGKQFAMNDYDSMKYILKNSKAKTRINNADNPDVILSMVMDSSFNHQLAVEVDLTKFKKLTGIQ